LPIQNHIGLPEGNLSAQVFMSFVQALRAQSAYAQNSLHFLPRLAGGAVVNHLQHGGNALRRDKDACARLVLGKLLQQAERKTRVGEGES
jgi:hypothetical protein